jgi:hypothetical protein
MANELLFIIVIAAVVAAFAITIVYLILMYVNPALKTPGRYFIEAYRKKKIVVAMDAGNRWVFHAGKLEKDDFVRVPDKYDKKIENMIIVTPKSIKHAPGCMFAVGEDMRASLINPALASLINDLVKKRIPYIEFRKAMEIIDCLIREKMESGDYFTAEDVNKLIKEELEKARILNEAPKSVLGATPETETNGENDVETIQKESTEAGPKRGRPKKSN